MAKGIILVTGAAGFIGSTLVDRLLGKNHQVIGIDNFNDYYDPKIKEANIQLAIKNKDFKLYRADILNFNKIRQIFTKEKPEIVVHLAARAGVRPSIENPKLYGEVNILGTVNLLKLSADFKVRKFIFGSSSSVYGNSKRLPFTEDDPCSQIISPYGSSKRSAEFFVESFAKNTDLKCVILRFFTVYGPRGRPDMAPFLFTNAITKGLPVKQFGDGSTSRDYTYIDDVVDGILLALNKNINFEIINLGNNHPVALTEFIEVIEQISGKKALVHKIPLQTGDVLSTWANLVGNRRFC
ncbi:MAG: CapI [Candidatus Gottesmanbacteria bacterium GW2011_GWA1_43_11]|uniref:CapI n=1 Tax=Candidatus Gottesmanbacteria bacterium GW2011_GWA1_43_11 TaxID=1618436 RepID=A0A0G1CCY1_9BACT|nr:MAG: CapI [Candidatus Gottesmanbacteria bacterium GW2011_GWA1_43_11]